MYAALLGWGSQRFVMLIGLHGESLQVTTFPANGETSLSAWTAYYFASGATEA